MRHVAVIAFAVLFLVACSKSDTGLVDEPIVAAVDAGDKDVAEHVEALLKSVRGGGQTHATGVLQVMSW